MSSALAIAGVTAVMKDLLLNRAVDEDWTSNVGEVRVSALPPDRISMPTNGEYSQLNLFLVHVSENTAWRNRDYPSLDSAGRRVSNPPLALDLHYLLSAYSSEELHAEILLGYAMQLLHETPVLSRDAIRTALGPTSQVGGPNLPPALRALGTSELAEQLELVKFVPTPLTTEEISRLWNALQTPYRPSATYQASVVLIDSQRPTKSAVPVLERRLHVLPFERPFVDRIAPQIGHTGETLTLTGRNLSTEGAEVLFGTEAVAPTSATDTSLAVVLPPSVRSGVQGVQVNQPLDFGTGAPSEPHRGFRSNVVAFVLAPTITTALPTPPMQIARGATLTLGVAPEVGRAQEVALVLGDRAFPLAARPASGPESSTLLEFPVEADAPLGEALVRVRVDGAESALETDPNGLFSGPKVEVVA